MMKLRPPSPTPPALESEKPILNDGQLGAIQALLDKVREHFEGKTDDFQAEMCEHRVAGRSPVAYTKAMRHETARVLEDEGWVVKIAGSYIAVPAGAGLEGQGDRTDGKLIASWVGALWYRPETGPHQPADTSPSRR